jgi:phosphotransferase system HPr (HPr) family protein
MSASSETVEATATATIPEGVDLHARPAADLVRAAGAIDKSIALVLALGAKQANPRSILGLLGLGATSGTTLSVTARGSDREAVDEALATIVGVIQGLHE